MPEYLYQHPSSGETISIIQSIHDDHEYIDKKKIKLYIYIEIVNLDE
jgi:predicted nucleic acid-binding Zn ribbon protein